MTISAQLEQQLQRWTEAGILDLQQAARIRDLESSRETTGLRWPVILAIAFGAIMVAAGILLFVAAHWDDLSPAQRFALVIIMIAGFHLSAGALIDRLHALGLALHGVGTVALGGGIFLAGQIFNLQEHWPGGILLWAIGAAATWAILQDWVQATLTALLVPAWLACEWGVRAEHYLNNERILAEFVTLVAIAYLGASHGPSNSFFRRALTWIGGIAVLPSAIVLAAIAMEHPWTDLVPMALRMRLTGFLLVFALPLIAAWLLRGKAAIWNIAFAFWAFLLSLLSADNIFHKVAVYGLCALASIMLVMWGLREQRRERINLGVAAFAITIVAFYFSTVMDKLGRSASLVAFGLLFLLGGWKLEQLRRKLVARALGTTA
jgi:uncharacterized membrane protein